MGKNCYNPLGQPIGQPLDQWQACQWPPASTMQGQFCSLVPTDVDAHSPALFKAFAKDTSYENWTYLPYGPFDRVEDFKEWLQQASAGADPQFHTVLDSTATPVGLATYLRINPPVGVIEVGHIHFSPLMQRTPVATEAMYLMMKRVFDELGYRRYEWKCDALNEPSRAAAKRLGFEFEGVFRQATIYKNRNRDTAWLAIIDSDWPALKEMFEIWLQPGNFDENGVQRRSLQACKAA